MTSRKAFSNLSRANEEEPHDEGTGSEGGEDTRRLSHNEIERRRRDNQRERLEELRRILPNMRDSKASMVATIVRAKDYIQQLQTRVADLERMLAMSQVGGGQGGHFNPHGSFSAPSLPHLSLSGQYGSHIGPLPSIAPKPLSRSPPPVSYSMSGISSPYMTAPMGPVTHGAPLGMPLEDPEEPLPKKSVVPFKRGRHGSTALFSVAEEVKQEEEHLPQRQQQPQYQPPSEVPQEDAVPGRKRRDSALLLPTADPNLYLYGHRDSMQNLFAAPLPFIMQQQEQKEVDLRCAKCARGINNLIMIDCDKCHTWYHIRCIGLDPERIPVHWSCGNCPQSSHQ